MGVRRQLKALTDNSSKFRDHRKHLSPSTITPTLTITLLKYPYPNLNLTLIQKTKALCKLGQFFRLSRTSHKFSTSCRVPNKIAWHWDTHIPLSTLSTHTMLNVRELTAIGNRWNPETRPTNVVQNDGYRENDGYRVPAGYRVQHIFSCTTTLDKKKRPLRLCIKSKHCSYHAISAWSGDLHSGTTGRDFAHRCTPKRNQAWFFDIPW